MTLPRPAFVYLVGSVPLESTADMFQLASKKLKSALVAVPDGEIGERKSFVQWQRIHLPSNVRKPMFDGTPPNGPVSLTIENIAPVRYDTFAIESYRSFADMRRRGLFESQTRFQVCLPTPNSVVRALVETSHCAAVEPLYERRLLEALDRIQSEIPPEDLLIQWDMPIDIAMLEMDRGKLVDPFFVDFFRPYFAPVPEGILERFRRLAKVVHPRAQMALHMCYGNYKQKHWLEPESVELLVRTANSLISEIGTIHSIDYVHMPVPKDRQDTDYLAPLKDLNIGSTCLILGLIHGFDLAGTRARIQTAKSVCSAPFGVSTECGLTNKPLDYLNSVFEISASVVE